jgi:type I restriction-modification system DNA methylase subunit
MDKQQATTLISSTFENAFDEGQYLRFLRELFNGQIDESDDRKFDLYGQYIPDSFKESVRRYKRLGTYTDPDGHEIDLLVVILRRDGSLERARTMQRNFAAYHLKRREKETAIIAYTTEERGDWRFSMVRREPVVAFSEKGNLIARDELTPVRRYSFLVGQNERSHTAQQQLFPILVDDKNDPTLDRLEEAFNIETVTKEFFERYKNLFLQLKEELDRLIAQNPRVRTEFNQKGLETANFAKKLLGQIVFLYFLQKKGWLGVRQGDNWGAGPKNFLRQLFDRNGVAYDNFFNDVLEPLFYEALAIERRDNIYTRLNVKIPFLNGGLFEPVGNYDWRNIDMLIDNGVFKSIFDTFDLYNFTVREDEPLEKEVAVDPEMLGKVFENLLEVTDRKSKGAFYTPREIVHYMCQESLINYLDTRVNMGTRSVLEGDQPQQKLFDLPPEKGEQLSLTETIQQRTISREDIATFIRFGELAVQNDIAKEAGTKTYDYQMPESIRTHAKKLDDALANIKICDPAIGSGAFPVGMMQEIIKAREVLTTYLGGSDERTTYRFKRQAIQESIYGVDIDPGAIDIAKLRLWLSLVVDEDNYQHIKPLPNLDYKIICGNSLSAVEKNLFNLHLFQELEQLKDEYFDETDPDKKHSKKRDIDQKIAQLTNNNDSFDYEIYFSEVFPQKLDKSQRGFDVVIANPPYIRHERIKEFKDDLRRLYPEVYVGTADLYVYFFAQGLRILKEQGVLTFITPNKFLLASYGKNLRQHLAQKTEMHLLIDFGDLHVFDATTYPFITITRQRPPIHQSEIQFLIINDIRTLKSLAEVSRDASTIKQSDLRDDGWQLIDGPTMRLLQKLRTGSTPMGSFVEAFFRGILTGLNEAFVIDESTRNRLIVEDPNSIKLIKKWLRGRDVKRWKTTWDNLYVIIIPKGTDEGVSHPWKIAKHEQEAQVIFQKTYPAIYRHLSQFEDALRKRQDQGDYWWELRACAYYWALETTKIVYPDISQTPQFTLDREGYYIANTLYCIPDHAEFLLGILNSRVIQFFYSQISPQIQNGYFRFIAQYMRHIPIPNASNSQQQQIDHIVRQLLQSDKKRSEAKELERSLNSIVYRLYGLTDEEIDLIERSLDRETIIKADSALSELTELEGDF